MKRSSKTSSFDEATIIQAEAIQTSTWRFARDSSFKVVGLGRGYKMTQQMSVASSNGSSGADSSSEVMLDDGDNPFSFYELWNHEIHVLKTAIDEKIMKITERSQREIDRLTATVTGMNPKSSSNGRYKIRDIGPKIPPSQWSAHRALMKQMYEEQQMLQKQQQKPTTKAFNTVETIRPGYSDTKSIKSSSRDLRLSPSCRSHTTATSDKTIPQSNLSSVKKYPPHIITNVLSIPEEASLQPTTEGDNDNEYHDTLNIMTEELENEEMSQSRKEFVLVKSSSTSSDRDIFVDAISHISESNHDNENKSPSNNSYNSEIEILEEVGGTNTIEKDSFSLLDHEDFHDIPSMLASMSLSSGSQKSDRSDTKSPASVPELKAIEVKSQPKHRKFDLLKERRSPVKNDERSLFPWLKEKLQPFHRRMDAPSFTLESKKTRPDAPPSLRTTPKNFYGRITNSNVSDDHDLMVIFEDALETSSGADQSNKPIPVEASTIATNNIGSDKKKGTQPTQLETINSTKDNTTSLVQPEVDFLASFPSIEETIPSLTDREIAAIFQSTTDDKTVETNQSMSMNSSQQQQKVKKHRKPPPSPETFMMPHCRKKAKHKKQVKNPVTVQMSSDDTISTFLNESSHCILGANSMETSTIDTVSKVEENVIGNVSSVSQTVHDNEGMTPNGDDIDPSLIRLEYVTNRKITDPYNDEGFYTGIVIRGKPETHGTMKYADGRFYTGSWKRGRWNGHGQAIFANGDSYTGDYVNDQRHGVGRYEWSDARVYDGRFENDQREGHGTYSWPNGSVYSGDFHLGLRHGSGTYTYEDGSVYCGEWENGKQHGNGECVWADGRCFRGEWRKGLRHLGVEVRSDGTIRHDGKWHNNRPVHSKASVKKIANQPTSLLDKEDKLKPSLQYLRQGKSLVRSISYSPNSLEHKSRIKTTSTSVSE